MVNTLMKDELAREGGIHALQLTTRTPQEEENKRQKLAPKFEEVTTDQNSDTPSNTNERPFSSATPRFC
jgi:hypothetical protein